MFKDFKEYMNITLKQRYTCTQIHKHTQTIILKDLKEMSREKIYLSEMKSSLDGLNRRL